MSYDPGECVGSTYNHNYSSCHFTTDSMAGHINSAAHNKGINPATLATIASLETLSGSGAGGINVGCDPCDTSGAGVCQIGKAMFDKWNAWCDNKYTWCSSICGSNYYNNLAICAAFLSAAFKKLKSLGNTNQIQMMAMAATAWNGNYCGHSSNAFYPWSGQTGYYLPKSDQLTQYGASAGALFNGSGHVGKGVLDTSISL
ncbi:hypothetical protein [Desulfoscipio gibsoniae]|uniref:Uncharacterized protein n=1 Tax=Desulfoscipio gibsoniae DSM 7213 TaxID=767817 RepID=R4KEE3_9FIRM|nr:hypothetical protein [Desulfoscipio gibsoniae]AGL00012.1 hypothetical protein Desgi_0436 [Desulfoscipio gibsoniae DSM 7213]